jgi:hypothetical protein
MIATQLVSSPLFPSVEAHHHSEPRRFAQSVEGSEQRLILLSQRWCLIQDVLSLASSRPMRGVDLERMCVDRLPPVPPPPQ